MILTRNLVIALIATIISFSTLYIPQPMLPLLADSFGVSVGEAGLLMTLAMLPLAVAPVVYGYFLQAIPARLMLIVALGLLALNQVCFYLVEEFWQMLLLRFLQGLLLPAIFTALMTYCASTVPVTMVRRALGFYIGATILGGFCGRLVGGIFASWFDWHTAFVVMGLMQLLPLILLLKAESDADINFARLDRKSVYRVLGERNYRLMFIALASVFFVFSGILNIIPFHLRDLEPGSTPLVISMLYLGYLIGAPVSFCSDRISGKLRDERTGLLLGLGIHACGLVMLLFVAFHGLILMMFLLAAGFFLMHALLSGLANHIASEHRGVVNGLYVSIYYFSGALGSWLPGYLYEALAWRGMILLFMLILVVCAWSIIRFDNPASRGNPPRKP
ncbi:MAG: MFS transporter [Gammaproteobacteria bacterium]|nr:MFS transporter [Gammaproteobacteria bacterium]MDH3534730.1 MFS transporter [Gammaproteobacteria bacterium]